MLEIKKGVAGKRHPANNNGLIEYCLDAATEISQIQRAQEQSPCNIKIKH
jgi:hypothetical protein